MHIICLIPLEPGVYNDHKADHITTLPEGWAYIPTEDGPIPEEWKNTVRDYSLPDSFPRLGSIEAEELTYIRDVTRTRKIKKTRDVDSFDAEGNPITITEEYEEDELYTEQVQYTLMTVTEMTPGIMPEPVPKPDPGPTTEERVTALEDALAQTDEAAIELYEAQAVQEEINAAQDEALIELYEMIGG